MLGNEQNIEENEQHIPINFDEANQAALELMREGNGGEQGNMPPDAIPEQLPPQGEPITPEQQNQGEQPATAQPTPDASQIATPQPPPEVMLQQAFNENQALRAENERLQQAMAQMSEANKQNVVEKALEMPVLDFGAMAYDDAETVQRKQNEYTQKMAEYMKSTMLQELSPFIQQAQEGIAQKEKSEVVSALSAFPELQDFNSMLPQLDNIIANNRVLSNPNVPLDERYIVAYLMAQGLASRNKKDELSPERFMQYYQSNPELQDLINKQRLAAVKGAQDVPPLSPSSGAVNAALDIPKTPTNFDEANELIKKTYFN